MARAKESYGAASIAARPVLEALPRRRLPEVRTDLADHCEGNQASEEVIDCCQHHKKLRRDPRLACESHVVKVLVLVADW